MQNNIQSRRKAYRRFNIEQNENIISEIMNNECCVQLTTKFVYFSTCCQDRIEQEIMCKYCPACINPYMISKQFKHQQMISICFLCHKLYICLGYCQKQWKFTNNWFLFRNKIQQFHNKNLNTNEMGSIYIFYKNQIQNQYFSYFNQFINNVPIQQIVISIYPQQSIQPTQKIYKQLSKQYFLQIKIDFNLIKSEYYDQRVSKRRITIPWTKQNKLNIFDYSGHANIQIFLNQSHCFNYLQLLNLLPKLYDNFLPNSNKKPNLHIELNQEILQKFKQYHNINKQKKWQFNCLIILTDKSQQSQFIHNQFLIEAQGQNNYYKIEQIINYVKKSKTKKLISLKFIFADKCFGNCVKQIYSKHINNLILLKKIASNKNMNKYLCDFL